MNAVLPVVRAIPGFCQPVSSLSHLVAAGVALMGAVPLLRLGRGSSARTKALAVYTFCVVVALAISGTYHATALRCTARTVLQRCDYYAIWLLIAGTFTAVHGVMCRGFWRTGMLAIIWSCAAVGMLLQTLWFDTFSAGPGLALYLGLGWVGLASIIKIGREIGYRAVRPIWLAGIAYTTGAALEAWGHPVLVRDWIGPHEIFHFAVIVGVAVHWTFIRRMVLIHARVPAASLAR